MATVPNKDGLGITSAGMTASVDPHIPPKNNQATGAGSIGVDRSGSIAVGGTAQSLAPANSARVKLSGQNKSSGDLYINEVGGTASSTDPASYRVAAGSNFTITTPRIVSIWGATTGQSFAATET